MAINNNERNQLTEIKDQLDVIQNRSALETEQLVRITRKLQSLAPLEPLAAAGVANIIVPPQVIQMRQVVPFIVASPIAQSLDADEVSIHEKGETSFQALYMHLMTDMSRYTGNIDYMIWYSALVLNMFMHIATFTPHDGHGKAQLREFNHKSQLQYYRSQGSHPNATFFKALIKIPGDTCTSRLPFNEGFVTLISSDSSTPKFCAELKKIDPKTGYPKPETKVSGYVMTQVAHAGIRKNNFSTLIQGMKKVVEGHTNATGTMELQKKLRGILPPTKTIIELGVNECSRRINELLMRFNNVATTYESTVSVDEQLSSHLLNYRIGRVQAIKDRVSQAHLQHIVIDSRLRDITCLMIRLYPQCGITDDTYTEGVTNVLLSFFGALLNHNAQQKGLRLHTERRQSFGYLRPTLTDAGCLMLRLSLGLEPTSFDDIVVASLIKFDDLLEQFKFDQKTHASVSRVFEYCKPIQEKEDGKRKPRDPDTYIRSVVRKDNLSFTTFHQAKAYLDNAAEQTRDANYPDLAMSDFLEHYVRNDTMLPLRSRPLLLAADAVQIIASPIVNVLQNSLVYAFDFVRKLVFMAVDEPLQSFSHVYLHSLLKLFNTCQAAQHLLTQATRIDAAEFHHQALLLTEDMLEYLISLDGLRQIRAELQQQPINPIDELRTTELAYATRSLQIPADRVQLFFTDSGQQAITTTLLTLSIALHGPAADGRTYDGDIYLFGNGYYEVAEFIKDCKKDKLALQIHLLQHAKIVFVDISQLDQLPLEKCRAMQALVIDTTHHPLFDNAMLRQVIDAVHQRGIWVTLVESSLKHAQLGLDKYQAGKIMIITPPGLTLSPAAHDLFERVSRDAIHPSAASYLSMVNAICREKQAITSIAVPPVKDKIAIQALVSRGFALGVGTLQTSALLPENENQWSTPSMHHE